MPYHTYIIFQEEDSLPVHITVKLVDEIFDLGSQNQWLRRQLTILLKQLMSNAFGGKINRKLVDVIEWVSSTDQISNYIKTLW